MFLKDWTYNSCMGKHIGIWHDGSIYGCNRDFPKELCFGNVHEYTDIRECFVSEGYTRLLGMAIERRNRCKEICDVYDFCVGGCNSAALAGGDITMHNEYVCDTMKAVYKHIKERVLKWIGVEDAQLEDNLNSHVVEYFKKNRS